MALGCLDGVVDDDLHEPRGEGTFGVEAADLFVDAHERALHHVFGKHPVPHDQIRRPHRPDLMLLYQRLQPADVAVFQAIYRSSLIHPHPFSPLLDGRPYPMYLSAGEKV